MTPKEANELPRGTWFDLIVPEPEGSPWLVRAKVVEPTPEWWPFAWPMVVTKEVGVQRGAFWITEPVTGSRVSGAQRTLEIALEQAHMLIGKKKNTAMLKVFHGLPWTLCRRLVQSKREKS